MKSKLMLTMLALTLAISLVAGGTMAWFTATDTAADATFTAGTVDIDVDGPVIANIVGTALTNWNPGDRTPVEWTFRNTGSKAMVFRAVPTASWTNNLDTKNIILRIHDGVSYVKPVITIPGGEHQIGDWMIKHITGDNTPAGGSWEFYYVGDAIASGDSVTLQMEVEFYVYPNQTLAWYNDYQLQTFTLGGSVLAVQASNGAPNDVFNVTYYNYLP